MTPRESAISALRDLNEYRGTPVHNAVLTVLKSLVAVYSDEWERYDVSTMPFKQGAVQQAKLLHQTIDNGVLDLPVI